MKKFFGTSFVLLTLLALTTGTVFAGSVVDLVSTGNNGGGPTFTFRVSGEFSPSELESGFVTVEGGDTFQLFCSQTDATTVVCHTSKKTSGQNVVVSFGGAKFWAGVPEYNPQMHVQGYCYTLFDLTELAPGWQPFGEYCMDREAVDGDTYVTYNPYVNEPDLTYYYELIAPEGAGNNPGEGYYPIPATPN